MTKHTEKFPVPSLQELYPQLPPRELEAVSETLDRFIDHGIRMYERIRGDSEAYAQFKALTTPLSTPTIKEVGASERSTPPAAEHIPNG